MAQARVTFTPTFGKDATNIGAPTIRRVVREYAFRVRNEAARRCPVDTGGLRASLTVELYESGGIPAARVGSNLPYAIYVHEGTGIYGPRHTPVRPRNAKVLRWPVVNNTGTGRRRYKGGKTARFAFAKQVKGVKPRPFLREALQAVSGTVV